MITIDYVKLLQCSFDFEYMVKVDSLYIILNIYFITNTKIKHNEQLAVFRYSPSYDPHISIPIKISEHFLLKQYLHEISN